MKKDAQLKDYNMEFTFFLKGIAIGFVMAVPVGPIGIMCIRKTLTEGRLRALMELQQQICFMVALLHLDLRLFQMRLIANEFGYD